MPRYAPEPAPNHGTPRRTAVLLVNLGTPEAPTAGAAAAAAARVLGQENPHMRIRCVDVAPGQDPRDVASALALAAVDGRRGAELLVAGRPWGRHLEPSEVTGPSAIRRWRQLPRRRRGRDDR